MQSWKGGTFDAAAFAGHGTLAQGFSEAPQPNAPNYTPSANYPLRPNNVNPQDWLYGVAPVDLTALAAALNTHLASRDTLILPIVSPTGYGAPAQRQIIRFGLFRVANNGANIKNGLLEIDLAYLGDVQPTTCFDPGNELSPVGIEGRVSVRPSWKTGPTNRDPISYQILLDTSGSMSLDLKGFAGSPSAKQLCIYNSTQVDGYSYSPGCVGGGASGHSSWSVVSERRITQAQNAINAMIDGLDPTYGDTMRIVSYTNDVFGSGNTLVTTAPSTGWSSDKSAGGALRTAVTAAGTYNGQPNMTEGATPTSDALNQTLKLLQSGSAPASFNGKPYKQVVILITDGIPNVFFQGGLNTAEDICPNGDGGLTASVTPFCQAGKTAGSVLRPIDAMIKQADAIKALPGNPDVYVVAVSDFKADGLDQVPTDPAMLARADQQDEITSIMRAIQKDVTGDSVCIPHTATVSGAVSTIPTANEAPFAGHADPYGYVYLYDENGVQLPGEQGKVPLVQTPEHNGGQLGWYLPPEKALLLGKKYFISAEAGYKSSIDGQARLYTKLFDGSSDTNLLDRITLIPSVNGASDTVKADDLTLMLDPAVEICPASIP